MISRALAPRWAFWALAATLLLKAAMPLFAAASAQVQGRTLVEVCTVYGVATVDLGVGSTPDRDAPAAPHASEHCALGAVVALGVPAPVDAAMALPIALSAAVPAGAGDGVDPPDAGAAWAARLHHAPPSAA